MPPSSPYASHHHYHQPPPPPPPLPFEASRSPPPPPPPSSHMPPPPPPPSEPEPAEQGVRRGTKRKVPEEPPPAPAAPAPVENFKCERDLSRFEKLGKLEEGAFGVVYRARDKDSGQVVALKKMKRRKEEHEEGVPLSVLREIKIGVLLQGNVNIINIRDIIFEETDDWEDVKDGGSKRLKDDSQSSGRGSGDKEKEKEADERNRLLLRRGKGKEIYLVMDFIDHDLGRLLKEMRERKEVFAMTEIKSLLYQLLSSVAHMHALGIIHRDIKTNNLLLGNDGILRLTDFGLSREYYMSDNNDKKKNKDEWAQMNGENGMLYTPTVVTLRYRSMELLLGVKEYTTAIDMWSCGVIFAELVNGGSFFKSHLEIEQIYEIIELLGTPTERHWPGLARLDVIRKKRIIFPHQPNNLLHKRFGASLSRTGFELLSRMLHYNPDKRISAAEALAHPFFSEEPLPQLPAPRYYDSKW